MTAIWPSTGGTKPGGAKKLKYASSSSQMLCCKTSYTQVAIAHSCQTIWGWATTKGLNVALPSNSTLLNNKTPSSKTSVQLVLIQLLYSHLQVYFLALLTRYSLLSSYSLWFFCCTWSSILSLDDVPKRWRNIWNTPTTDNKVLGGLVVWWRSSLCFQDGTLLLHVLEVRETVPKSEKRWKGKRCKLFSDPIPGLRS
jgi:hypothetical protein